VKFEKQDVNLNTEHSDSFETDFERDEVDCVAGNLYFLLIDADEFEFGICSSESSNLFDHKKRPSAIWKGPCAWFTGLMSSEERRFFPQKVFKAPQQFSLIPH
jgi:hypothetical protein